MTWHLPDLTVRDNTMPSGLDLTLHNNALLYALVIYDVVILPPAIRRSACQILPRFGVSTLTS